MISINLIYKLQINYQDSGGWHDISSLLQVNSQRLPMQRRRDTYDTSQKCTTNSCKFTLAQTAANYATFASSVQAIYTNAAYVLVYIQWSPDGVTWSDFFSGLIRPTFDLAVGPIKITSLTIECVDIWYLLNFQQNQLQIGYYGYKISNPANKAQSILHQLFYAAGYADSQLNLPSIPITVAAFVVPEYTLFADVLGEVIFEYGYVANVDPSGVIQLYPLAPNVVTPIATLSPANKNMLADYKSSRQENQYQAVDVSYYEALDMPNTVVHNDTTNNTSFAIPSGATCAISIAASIYYPVGASATQDIYADFQVANYTLIGVDPSTANLSWNNYVGDIEEVQFIPEATRARIKFTSSGGGVLYTLQVIGNAKVLGDKTILSLDNIAGSPLREQIDLKYVFDNATAQQLMSLRASWYLEGKYQYTIKTNVFTLNMGDYVQLTDSLSGISQLCRVLTVQDGDNIEYATVTLEGFSVISLQTPTTVFISQNSVPPQPMTAVFMTNGIPSNFSLMDCGNFDGTAASTTHNWDCGVYVPAGSAFVQPAEMFDCGIFG